MGTKISKQVMDFLEEHGMERKLSNKIGIAIEEMVENIYKFSSEKNVHIDLRLVVNKEIVVLSAMMESNLNHHISVGGKGRVFH